jgi:hypothetical protein
VTARRPVRLADPNAQDPLRGLGPDPPDTWAAVAPEVGQLAYVADGDASEHGDPLDADPGGA